MNQRNLFKVFVSIAVILTGCSKIEVTDHQFDTPEGEMAVRLGISSPAGLSVRSYISGEEQAISTIVMLCFDGEGKYITYKNAEVHPSSTDPATKGTLTGNVPSNTCRIHFIANYSPNLSSIAMGSLERAVMKTDLFSSDYDDDVKFWGYHSETSSSLMKSWLSGGNTVMLLRDRAKVILKKASTANGISEIQWTIANGLNKGYLAPTTASGNNPYTNDYTTATRLTEYTSSGRYSTMDEDGAIWAEEDEPQYLFENANPQNNPVKIIIKTTYTDNKVKYHTVLLQSNEGVPYQVMRNQTFVLTLKNLPEAVGSDDFDDALTTTDYSNNPYAQVDREVEEISNGTYTLKVEKNVKLFNTNGTGTIGFTYTPSSEFDASNFSAIWEAKPDTDETDDVVASDTDGTLISPSITFDPTTGEGTITFPLATLNTELKHNSLQLIAKNSGMSRFVDVYSITQFSFATRPQLKDNNTTRTVGGKSREVYKLTFALPEDFPPSQYPVRVKMYTSTLVPYSDNSAGAPSGVFDVVVASTASLTQSTSSSAWNYQAQSWGQYYEYVIEQPSSDNSYTIYMYDIRANYSRTINNVGLYFHIDGFGNPIPLTAQTIQYGSQTFQGANFSFSNNTGSAYLDPVSVTLGNSDWYRDSRTVTFIISRTYYSDYSLRIGRDNNNGGTITVAAPSGMVISSIEVTYFHRTEQGSLTQGTLWEAKDFVGGNVTASSGTYSKSGLTGTWAGDATESVTLTMARDSENESPRITSIKVNYQTAVE